MTGDFCQRDAHGFCHLAPFCGAMQGQRDTGFGCTVRCQADADAVRARACDHYARLGRARRREARTLAEAGQAAQAHKPGTA